MIILAAVAAASPILAENLSCDDRGNHWSRLASHCEMREQTVPAPGGPISVDGLQNGGVSIRGWNRNEVLVRAKVETGAESEGEAAALARSIQIQTAGGRIEARGPSGDEHWAVSYEVFVPERSDLNLKTHNGGVSVKGVEGDIGFAAVNGGVTLKQIAGRVHGQTVNGGLHIGLAGDHWVGEGMDVSTTNGGVHLSLPDNYSARLETSTVNGGMRVDFPVTIQGDIGKRFVTTLGSGGATLRAETTNGGVTINRGASL